jgi:hypothetical protein
MRVKCTINTLTYDRTPEIINNIIKYKKDGNDGLTFRFGTPFMHEMSSLWTATIDKTVKITVPEEDLLFLNEREKHDISLFNDMIQNAYLEPSKEQPYKDYIKIYLKNE